MADTNPHPTQHEIEARSSTLLEWPIVLTQLATHAVTPAGKERCLQLPGSNDPDRIETWYAEVREWAALAERVGEFPLASGVDPRPALHAAVAGGVLEAGQCRDVALVLEQARDVRRLLARAPGLPHLEARSRRLDELPDLRTAIDATIDPQGNLRESASPELRHLRREVDRLRRTIVERVEGLLRDPRYEPWLQDTFVTQREDRYVLPVRIEERARVSGIVHDVSASGATVFVEPEELVAANNELKWAELALSQEIERIFRRLTDDIARHRPALDTDLEGLSELDLIQAKGRLGRAYRGSVPRLTTDGAIAWRGLRHPLLALRGVDVVPNDVLLPPGIRTLVVSGPNTGGKTVLLKAIGLAALMTRAGLPLPCDPESESPVFPAVMVTAGDDQDLARDLSTFAGHVRLVAAMLATAPRGALVLIDELATATDPDEGAALARALLEALVAKGVVAVVTTHYAGLKAWATEGTTPGAPPADRMSAAMGYDVDALAPTYRLALGRPGLSLGLAVAARLGLPAAILERARALVAPQTAELERAIATLETDRRRVAEVGERLRALETAMRDAVLRQDAAAAALEREREKVAGAAARTIAADVERAKRAIDHILEAARREQTPPRRRLLRKELETLVPGPHPEPDASTHEFEDGARVRVRSLAADGVLLESTHGRRRVRVRVGDREVSVDRTQLATPADPDAPVRAAVSRETSQPVSETPPDTLHLLGLRVDEALMRVDRALDEAIAAGVARVRLLHGHGTGRLKAGIRSHLSSSPYVASHRPGEELEGGDAVTIVTLAI